MKKIFVFLLLVNIIVAFYFHTDSDDKLLARAPLIHPEKIVLLPAKVACLKWDNLLGPAVQQARAEISQWKLGKSHFNEVSKGEIIVYWVHVPPFRTVRETTRQINELEKLGVPHMHIQENEGSPWHNVISLAILRDESEAMALVDGLKNRGVTRVTNSEQRLEQFEFVIRNPSAQMTEQIQQLVQQFPETRLDITECDRI